MKRWLRVAATIVVTVAAAAYVVSQADLSATARILADADLVLVAAAAAVLFASVVPMAWRWQQLLRAKNIHERLRWLVRANFTSYAAGQILPTAIGGDALRIYETSRRHAKSTATVAASVLLERALGGAATLALAAAGLVLAWGRYDIGAYLWLEAALVAGTVAILILLFSRRARPLLSKSQRLLRFLRLERPVRAVYEAIHGYRQNGRLLVGVFALTLVVQAVRILAIWLTGKSVGVELSPRAYYVMGPLLFLVILIPFTINGLAVRESFFVSFLTTVGVSAEPALAAGLLFFVLTLTLAVPGLVIFAVESAARARLRSSTGAAPPAVAGDRNHQKG